MENRIAVIDTGTNSTRLMIADVETVQVREVERITAITRLGQGVDETGILGEAAMARVEACVNDYADRLAAARVRRTLLLATSSVREARNGRSFIDELARRYGFTPRVLDGDEEAELAFAGATTEAHGQEIFLFDIGGGSTELVTGTAPFVSASVSTKLGCVRIRERFLKSDPVTHEELAEARANIMGVIGKVLVSLPLRESMRSLAVAGTMTSLAAYDLGLERYSRAAIHGHVLEAARIRELLAELASMTLEEREAASLMERGRADVIVAGALIADVLMELGGIGSVSVSENDILDGAALEFAREK